MSKDGVVVMDQKLEKCNFIADYDCLCGVLIFEGRYDSYTGWKFLVLRTCQVMRQITKSGAVRADIYLSVLRF